MEIITGVERRRRWRLEEKLRIVAEAEQPGACFAEVARRHDVSRGLLWTWRREMRRAGQGVSLRPQFLPMQVVPEPATTLEVPAARPGERSRAVARGTNGMIEIALADGTTVRVGQDIGVAALRRVLGVLRG